MQNSMYEWWTGGGTLDTQSNQSIVYFPYCSKMRLQRRRVVLAARHSAPLSTHFNLLVKFA